MDIFDVALKMELESEKYYLEQAKITDFTDLRVLLEKLAEEEARHYKIVEALRLQNNELLPDDRSLAKIENIFTSYIKDAEALRKAISIEKSKEEQIDVYRVALVKENESVEVYEKMMAQAQNPHAKAIIARLIKEEQSHAEAMDEIVDLLNKVSDWVEAAEFNHTDSY
ncbi:MAG: ferritin family protein [Acidaminococcaceae bacterium]